LLFSLPVLREREREREREGEKALTHRIASIVECSFSESELIFEVGIISGQMPGRKVLKNLIYFVQQIY